MTWESFYLVCFGIGLTMTVLAVRHAKRPAPYEVPPARR